MFLLKVEKTLFYVLVFLLPSQLAYHFWPDWAFVFGVRVDYLAPAVYLTDILLILLLAVSRTKIKTVYLLGILSLALINIFISVSPWVSFWKWLKILELIFFAKYVYDNFNLVKDKTFSQTLSLSFILVSTLGILQVINGKTLGGIFYLMGERSFNLSTPAVALQTINGGDYLRAYSSFSHPNSLAGFLLLGVIYFLSLKKKAVLVKLALAISSLCLLLTFSLSAFTAAALAFAFYLLYTKNKNLFKRAFLLIASLAVFLSFLLPFAPIKSSYPLEVKERLEQAELAKESIFKNPLFGIGLNTFTLLNRSFQPVHNIFLLILAETGLIGFVAFSLLIYRSLRRSFSLVLLAVLVIGFFDHYFLTLQQNLLSLAFVFGTIFAKQKKLESKNKQSLLEYHGQRNASFFRRRGKR